MKGELRTTGDLIFGVLAILAILFVSLQVVLIATEHGTLCPNDGCKVVEGFLRVSSLQFNLLGLAFFASAFVLWSIRSKTFASNLLDLLLVSGAVAEGVLLNYQRVVAGVYCSYCLGIAAFVFLLLASRGPRVLGTGLCFLCIQAVLFSTLRFDVLPGGLEDIDLNHGTYAVRNCSEPEKRVYLIFSEECPHCKRVIRAMEGCSRCELHFNPLSRISEDLLPDTEKTGSYDPGINRLTLKLLGIDAVPVMIAEDPDGLTFIKGEKRIIEYIQRVCFGYDPLLEGHWSDLVTGEGGVCSTEKECSDQDR